MTAACDTIFLLDVDNTLLDNDRLHDDLGDRLRREFGVAGRDRYWAIFETLRAEAGYADYLGALQRYRCADVDGAASDPRLLQMSAFLLDYPFADRLYPGALKAIAHLRTRGPTVILSDGDIVFQPRQGHYALDAHNLALYPPADITIDSIGDLPAYDFSGLSRADGPVVAQQEAT